MKMFHTRERNHCRCTNKVGSLPLANSNYRYRVINQAVIIGKSVGPENDAEEDSYAELESLLHSGLSIT